MNLELKRKVLQVTVDGKTYSMNFPTVADLKKIAEIEKGAGEAIDMVACQFEVLGMPKDVFNGLEMEHIELLRDHLFPKKN